MNDKGAHRIPQAGFLVLMIAVVVVMVTIQSNAAQMATRSQVTIPSDNGFEKSQDELVASLVEEPPSSPYGWDAWAIAIAPSLPQTLYTGFDPGRIYRSIDSGDTWLWRGNVWYVYDLVVDPLDPDTAYVANNGGFAKTTDGGITWTYGSDFTFASDLAMAPSDRNVIYAGTIWSGIYKTTDGGNTWTAVNTGLPDTGTDAVWAGVAVSPTDPDVAYCGKGPNGVYKTTNGGASWFPANTGIETIRVSGLAVSPADENVVFATGSSIYASIDGGAHWTQRTSARGGAITIAPSNPDTIYVATFGDGVVRSTDGGYVWDWLQTGLPSSIVRQVAVHPIDSQIVYAATVRGLAKSNDGGDTWMPKYDYLTVTTVDPASGGSVTSDLENTTISFPAGAFTKTAEVTFRPVPMMDTGNLLAFYQWYGRGEFFDLSAADQTTGEPLEIAPGHVYTITTDYYDSGLGPIIESTLGVYCWDGSGWQREPTSYVDEDQNRVIATPNHLSIFVVLGETNRAFLPLVLKNY